MKNAFVRSASDRFVEEHPELAEPLARRIYTSRLLGAEPSLVLHGGGNTSVKLAGRSLAGVEKSILYVKGSGADLATIDEGGFTAVDLERLRALRALELDAGGEPGELSEEEMENELLTSRVRADAPAPSVETLLHAFLPHAFVDHTHADAVLIATNRIRGDGDDSDEARVVEIFGEGVAVLPYLMPGLPLALQVAGCYDVNPDLTAIISLHHGLFTFADDSETSYARMIDVVTRAEKFIEAGTGRRVFAGCVAVDRDQASGRERAARLVQAVRGRLATREAGDRVRRWAAELRCAPELLEIAARDDCRELCTSGALTPDHVTRTKNAILTLGPVPDDDDDLSAMVDAALAEYASDYDRYFRDQSAARGVERQKLDSKPRLILARDVGLIALGETPRAARVAADIGEHTLRAKVVMDELGGHVPIPMDHVFDMEYWTLQQRKLGVREPAPLEGQVAFVTGAGGAIGAGIADRLLAAGATVVISDVDEGRLEAVKELLGEDHEAERIVACACDVTDLTSVEQALAAVSLRLGGIDLLVPNAGIAHVASLETLEPERFSKVLEVNLMGAFLCMKAVIPIFRRQASGGNIVLISSKNVPDPGKAFGAYSASKAGAHQIAKIAALELAELGVRVNMVNPDAVFGDERVSSGLWDLIGPDRMKSRGLDPQGLQDYYRERNLLKATVRAEHVGNVVVFFASELSPTTGASFPVDGGVPSAFPR